MSLRFLIVVFAIWLAICLAPEREARAGDGYIHEKVWLSRTCPNGNWFLDESDHDTATLECYVGANDDGGN